MARHFRLMQLNLCLKPWAMHFSASLMKDLPCACLKQSLIRYAFINSLSFSAGITWTNSMTVFAIHTSWDRATSLKPSASNPPAPCETRARPEAVPAGGHPLDASERHQPCGRLGQPCAYLRVELASIVEEGHADFLKAPDFAGVVLETLEDAAAHVSCAHETMLDLSCRGLERQSMLFKAK